MTVLSLPAAIEALPNGAMAQSAGLDPAAFSHPLIMIGIFSATAVIPFFLLGTTSFLKLNIVLSILRNAVGAGQFPSGAVISLLSLVLTMQIMAPVARDAYKCAQSELSAHSAAEHAAKTGRKGAKAAPASGWSVDAVVNAAQNAAEPLKKFMRRQSQMRERLYFLQAGNLPTLPASVPSGEDYSLAAKEQALPGETFFSLVAAFVVSELRSAFAVGFVVYLPFLVVDLVVANLLAGLGMMMMSPVTISLPLKLILFVAADGWFLVCRALALSYM
ncbi:MAG TPA: flagellar type III secretion system pore protein FliP [Oligoflexia bacterium]|nr:flagellar type III secretion system pore protein FliP [Oligoflexia bacterium]